METEIIITTKAELRQLIKEALKVELSKYNIINGNEEPVLNSEEILKLLRISKSYLITLRRNGLPHYAIGTALRYRRSEVMEFMNRFKNKT